MDSSNNAAEAGRTRTTKVRRRRQTLPMTRRTGLSKLLITFAGLLSMTVSYATMKKDKTGIVASLLIIGLPFPSLFIVELMFRMLYAVEESQHLATRYDKSYLTLLKDVFYFPSISWLVTICGLIFNFMKTEGNPFLIWCDLGPTSMFSSLLGAIFLRRVFQLEKGPLYDSFWIQDSNGLDYGSGMAHSFFHGYLKLVIPKTGSSEKHLEELMKNYEAQHNVELVCYKLFILIPQSLYCPTTLMNEDNSPTIEESTSLDPKILTVAGVKDRVYKNSVYKIRRENGRKVYICAEYATPLKTFKDVVNHFGEHSSYYKRHKNEIVLQFYLTLKKVLKEHEDCTNYCELIYFDDKDENGQYKDVGQVLLEKVRKIERRNRELRGAR